ncbi:Cupin type-2 domain-containing protein [Bordetella sputigena]|uniref:cupin domain-containing protein n=1 Tax=Bordetella sputigena TaxID=1416810 RepID=UPI0039EE5626
MNQPSQQSGSAPASRGQGQTIDLIEKINLIHGHWQPRVVAEMNDYQFKVVKIAGDFIWHSHGDTDETFIVLEGEMRIEVRGPFGNTSEIILRAGQMAVVPKGVEHKPCAVGEVKLLLIEPRGVANTGDHAPSALTVANDQWV